jgi:NAD(P)-dependent dehydrogenase (short-subunit alcohol dehydrogenase family)
MSKKIALVTGASRGLGKNAVLKLAEQGIDVIFTYNSQREEAESVVREIEAKGAKAVTLQLNVAESNGFDPFVAQVKSQLEKVWQRENFDFLVNNAGIGGNASFAETTEEEFDLLMKKLLPLIADGGRVLNVSTGLTRFCLPGFAAYATMKGGMEVLTRYQAKELGARGISVNILAPGAIETDFGGGAVRDNQQINQYVAKNTALGRVGQPDDIGGMVAMLLSEQSGWANGQRIEASGGMFL